MPLQHFDVFVRTITNLPTLAILKALDLECKTLECDLESHRLMSTEDAFSILCFRQFVRMAKQGKVMRCVNPLPPDHTEFYKATIARLIEVKELPQVAVEQFDYTFHLGL